MDTREELQSLSHGDLVALLLSASSSALSLKRERDAYRAERDDYKDKLDRSCAERDRLRAIILKLERHQFGRRSERLSPDQLQLALEDLDQALAAINAKAGANEGAETKEESQARKKSKSSAPRNNNRGALPEHLPHEHRFIEPEEKVCPCCNGALHVIGEEVSEQLDRVPATLKVLVTHRPIRLPGLRRSRRPGSGPGAPHPRRDADRRLAGQHRHRQIW